MDAERKGIKTMAEVKKVATRESYGATLAELAAEYPNLVVLDADLAGATKTASFKKVCPERFIDCGIAEGNMMGVAAGLAAAGMIPFASSFAMFAAGRAFEQVRNSIGYPHLNVKIGATHAGISVGEDGATHQCCEDIALMRTIPGMVIINPADDDPQTYHFEMGKGITLRDGKDITIVATGLMVAEAIEAGKMLEEKGIDARIINIHTIKPLDEQLVCKAAQETGKIITVEEHSVIGGLGDAVCAAVNAGSNGCQVVKMGVHDVYGHSGPGGDLITEFGLRAANIVEEALKLL